jgi:hypothetical protein
MADGQVSVALSRAATEWHQRLTPERRAIVDERLRQLARYPERAIKVPEGDEELLTAIIMVRDREVWAYRVTFVVDEVMSRHLPAIKVLTVRQLPFPALR